MICITLGIQREEEKVKRSLKEAAKKGDKDVCLILAKEVIRARKAISKIYASKAHINSISMQMKNQLGNFLNLSLSIQGDLFSCNTSSKLFSKKVSTKRRKIFYFTFILLLCKSRPNTQHYNNSPSNLLMM